MIRFKVMDFWGGRSILILIFHFSFKNLTLFMFKKQNNDPLSLSSQ